MPSTSQADTDRKVKRIFSMYLPAFYRRLRVVTATLVLPSLDIKKDPAAAGSFRYFKYRFNSS
jgi:hypothetical protein